MKKLRQLKIKISLFFKILRANDAQVDCIQKIVDNPNIRQVHTLNNYYDLYTQDLMNLPNTHDVLLANEMKAWFCEFGLDALIKWANWKPKKSEPVSTNYNKN